MCQQIDRDSDPNPNPNPNLKHSPNKFRLKFYNPHTTSALVVTSVVPQANHNRDSNLNHIITTTLTYASQMRAAPSFDAVTTRPPSGEKAAHQT